MQEREQYQNAIRQLQFERDEAIRTKTVETTDLRRQNNALKELVRDLERQQSRPFQPSHSSDNFNSDFTFSSLDLGSDWDEDFSLIDNDDLKMEGEDTPQRQLTPRPPPASEPRPAISQSKDAAFSWNTFYMCLLFGAFIASNTNKDASHTTAASASLSTQLPTLSDDYRNEAGNVLKAVLASDGESIQSILPPRPSASSDVLPTTISGSDFSRMSGHATSSLDSLHASLITPTRQQRLASAFSLSTEQYNHITNPDGIFDDDEGRTMPKPPSQLEQMYANMQAQSDEQDRMMGSKARERSVLLDRVPEKVLKDFREMVEMSEKMKEKE